MYGWLDDRVVRVLQLGFEALKAAPSEWRRLFPPYVDVAARDELHALTSKVTCAIANMHATDVRPPLVTVEVTDSGSSELTPFAFEGCDDGAEGAFAELGLREAVVLRIAAATKHEVRSLALATRAIIISNIELFIEDWDYSDVRYLGAGAIAPARDYFPEQFGGFQVTQTWGTMGAAYVPRLNVQVGLSGPIFIARDDVVVDDGAGGTMTGGAHHRP